MDQQPGGRVIMKCIQSVASILHTAIKKGLVEKKPCEKCGDPKSEAHHDDYLKPLDVTWLCKEHHTARHQWIDATGHDTHRDQFREVITKHLEVSIECYEKAAVYARTRGIILKRFFEMAAEYALENDGVLWEHKNKSENT
jgi:hypothetical protein